MAKQVQILKLIELTIVERFDAANARVKAQKHQPSLDKMTMEMKGNCYTLSVAIGMLAVFGKLPDTGTEVLTVTQAAAAVDYERLFVFPNLTRTAEQVIKAGKGKLNIETGAMNASLMVLERFNLWASDITIARIVGHHQSGRTPDA